MRRWPSPCCVQNGFLFDPTHVSRSRQKSKSPLQAAELTWSCAREADRPYDRTSQRAVQSPSIPSERVQFTYTTGDIATFGRAYALEDTAQRQKINMHLKGSASPTTKPYSVIRRVSTVCTSNFNREGVYKCPPPHIMLCITAIDKRIITIL